MMRREAFVYATSSIQHDIDEKKSLKKKATENASQKQASNFGENQYKTEQRTIFRRKEPIFNIKRNYMVLAHHGFSLETESQLFFLVN